MDRFYLGTHMPHWLAHPGGPWFVSIRTLRRLRKLPRAVCPWAMDSGAFTELSMHGKWTVPYMQYVSEVNRASNEIGNLQWVAPMDWMCEPFILQKTGLDVQTHQARTVVNLLELRPWLDGKVIPVLQGWSPWDYLRHAERYIKCGVNLYAEPVIGVGSICRRQNTAKAATILTLLASEGFNLHAFGLKLGGLKLAHNLIKSADSMAWSFDARRTPHRLPGHTHKNCANCLEFAQLWRTKVDTYTT